MIYLLAPDARCALAEIGSAVELSVNERIRRHHVTGPWSNLAKIHVASLADIEGFPSEMKRHDFPASTETIVALSSIVDGPFIPKEGVI